MSEKIYGIPVSTPLNPEKVGGVKTVNGIAPDENGNIEVGVVGIAGSSDAIPEYWDTHLTNKIAAIKNLQRKSGKDCYSFVVIADPHYYGNVGKRSPQLIKKVMEDCGIKFCLCLGDIQNGGAWGTKELELAEWDKIDEMFKPIIDRTLMIPGNHDGAYGSSDINQDGVISDTTDYYIYNLTHDEVYDLIYRKVSLINGVTFDESYNGYYVDDTASKVRYILVNTHYSDNAVNEDGTAVNNYMRKIRVGQHQMNMVIDALRKIPDNTWHVIVGMHIPLANIADAEPSGDMVFLRNILEAYQNKTAYSDTFGTAGDYDYSAVAVDFSSAKGSIAGVFCGHVHTDGVSEEYAFPIITSMSDDTSNAKIDGVVVSGEVGTVTEQSFDVFIVNKRDGTINAVKIGLGSNREFGVKELYTNLADPSSADWYDEKIIDDNGKIKDSVGEVVTNFIPVVKGDVLRFKGLDTETVGYGNPGFYIYDENKTQIQFFYLNSAMQNDGRGLYNVLTTKDGVTEYTVLLNKSGAQFTYDGYCDKVRYIRFVCKKLTTSDDIIITVNEEILQVDGTEPDVLYTNLADPTSVDWRTESHYLWNGDLKEETNNYYNKTVFVSNFIPVAKNDILRFKGIDKETQTVSTTPLFACYDENKVFLRDVCINDAKKGTVDGFPNDVVSDENGVTSWTVMMRGDNNQQFVYDNLCDRIRYVRFSAHWLTSVNDIIITVNEEIV